MASLISGGLCHGITDIGVVYVMASLISGGLCHGITDQ